MIAYNKHGLDNIYASDQFAEAYNKKVITLGDYHLLTAKYPSPFFTPGTIARVGLFILTFIITMFALGLYALLFASAVKSFGLFFAFFAMLTYCSAEIVVNAFKNYKAGPDDALIWLTAGFVITAIFAADNVSPLNACFIVFVVTLCLALRFAHQMMAAFSWLAFLAVVFFLYTKMGAFAKATAPFVLMALSVAGMYCSSVLQKNDHLRHYSKCFFTIRLFALATLYAAGNYFVVRQAGISLMHIDLPADAPLPFGWLFWIFTFAIPIILLWRNVKKKDLFFIRVCALLFVCSLLTFRYYYHLLTTETALIIAGIIVLVLAWGLIKYLRIERNGINDEAKEDEGITVLQSVAIAQAFGQHHASADNVSSGPAFGGGSGGGGGAGGEF